jgi:hypothetical protein
MFQLGDETHSLGFKVFLGSTNTFAYLTPGPPAMLTLQNVTYVVDSGNIGTILANTVNVVGNTTTPLMTVNDPLTLLALDVEAIDTGAITGVTSGDADSVDMSAGTVITSVLNAVTTYNAVNTVYTSISTDTLLVNSNTTTGAMNVSGLATLPSVPLTGSAALQDLDILFAADDGTPVAFGNAARSTDLQVFVGGSNNILFDRGNNKLQGSGANIVTDSAVTVNAAAGIVSAVSNSAAYNGTTLNCSGSITTTGNTVLNTSASAESLTILPASDDGTLSVFGNATRGADVSIVLGSPNNVLFDRGNGALTLSGVELNSNSTLDGTTLSVTGDLVGPTMTTTDMNLTGVLDPIGNAYAGPKEYVNSTANALVSEADTGKLLTNIGASGTIAYTLPRPADVVDNTIRYEFLAAANQDLTIDVLGVRSAVFVSANKEYFYRANPAPVNTEPCTFACWFKTNTAQFQVMAEHGNSATFHFRALRCVASGLQAVAFESAPGVSALWANTTAWTDNEWHHAVAVFKNTTHREIWFDGVKKATGTTAQTVTTTLDRYHMGASRGLGAGSPSGLFDGSLANNETYNTALNANQISYLYNSGAGRSFRYLVDNNTDTNNPYDNMRSCYEYLETSGGSTDSKNGYGTNDGNTVGRSQTDGPILIPGTGDFISTAGSSADKAYTINTVNGHGRVVLNSDQQWVFLPYGDTTFTTEA